jgi:hypothetical protein
MTAEGEMVAEGGPHEVEESVLEKSGMEGNELAELKCM